MNGTKILIGLLVTALVVALIFVGLLALGKIGPAAKSASAPTTQQTATPTPTTFLPASQTATPNVVYVVVTATPAESQQAEPTSASPAGPAAPTSAAAPAQSGCPATQEVKNLTGVDVQRLGTETCAFVWRGTPGLTVSAVCPLGYVCTWDVVNDIVVVQLGVNQTATIKAGTWRFIEAYPPEDAVHDVCLLYQKEKAFGLSEIPSFQVRFQPVTDGTLGPIGPQSCE